MARPGMWRRPHYIQHQVQHRCHTRVLRQPPPHAFFFLFDLLLAILAGSLAIVH